MTDAPLDLRRFAPPALRNRDPITQILRKVLPEQGLMLQIAEGSGEHAVHFAKAFGSLEFQPTDPDPEALASIAAWRAHEDKQAGLANIRPPLQLDASAKVWPVDSADAVLCINMIHISPWAATQGLIRGAAHVLPKGGVLYLYGPYKRDGEHTAPSNAAFDESLRMRNATWGIRDLDDVAACASANGFDGPDVYEMPANNLSVVFRRG